MDGEKHTPGPWKVGRYLGQIAPCVHMDVGNKGRGIDIVESVYGMSHDERNANARLIAAAPRLLAALKTLMADGRIGGRDGAEARAAIAEATGEGA